MGSSNIFDIRDRDAQRLDEASTWIARLDRGLSPEDQVNLEQWLQAETGNAQALMELAALWDKMDALARLSELFPHPLAESPPKPWWGFSAAASWAAAGLLALALILSLRVWVDTPARSEIVNARIYETAVGSRSKVELTDGSEITLNTNSNIVVDLNGPERTINLVRGEIHIDVAHDPSRPLVVTAGERVITAIGTAFAVQRLPGDQVDLLVTEGEVAVSLRGAQASATPVLAEPRLMVSGGERVLLGASEAAIETLDSTALEDRLSWRDGNLVFRGERLADAVAEIGRYTSVDFVFVDDHLKSLRVAGLFKAGDVNGFLSSLQANFEIAYERTDKQTIVLTSAADAR